MTAEDIEEQTAEVRRKEEDIVREAAEYAALEKRAATAAYDNAIRAAQEETEREAEAARSERDRQTRALPPQLRRPLEVDDYCAGKITRQTNEWVLLRSVRVWVKEGEIAMCDPLIGDQIALARSHARTHCTRSHRNLPAIDRPASSPSTASAGYFT